MGEVFPDTAWLPAKDSRSIITRKFETVRFEEKGDYYLTWGAAGFQNRENGILGIITVSAKEAAAR